MARFMPRTELYLRSDIKDALRGLLRATQEVPSGEYRRGFLDALESVAASYDLGVVCLDAQPTLPLYSWVEAK